MARGDRHRIEIADRQRQALTLRKAGVAYERIARECGYAGPSGAYKAVQTALRKYVREPARELVQIECARLDEMLSALWPKVKAGDPRAVAAALAVMDHRAKLTGVYAPQKIDIEQRLREVAVAEGLDPDEAVSEARRILDGRRTRR